MGNSRLTELEQKLYDVLELVLAAWVSNYNGVISTPVIERCREVLEEADKK